MNEIDGEAVDPRKNAGDVRFNALRNALHHVSRRRIFEGWNRFANFVVVALGTAGVANAAGAAGGSSASSTMILIIGAATAGVGALQLTVDLGGRARVHELLQRRYYDLLADVEEFPDPDEATVLRWQAQLMRIYGEEPPVSPTSNALAFNAALRALGGPEENAIDVPWYARVFSWLWPFDGEDWPRKGAAAAESAHQQPPAGA